MQEISQYKLPKNIEKLSHQRVEILNELLENLYQDQFVSGLLLGGSLSYKEDIEKSDADLFCLIPEADIIEEKLIKNSYGLKYFDTIVYQGFFPWTEKLYTIYYKDDLDFSIDVCIISSTKQETFFWEPDGQILFDKEGAIERCRELQMNSQGFTRQPFLKSNPHSLAIVTLKKIEKNLSRGHLWNALEQLSILRRYLMQIIRIDVINQTNFLGRVDRDIEDVIPAELNKQFSLSIAKYDKSDIAAKAFLLSEMAESLTLKLSKSQEMDMQEWILKQLEHEKNKLSKHI
jgi:hypothetical protein